MESTKLIWTSNTKAETALSLYLIKFKTEIARGT